MSLDRRLSPESALLCAVARGFVGAPAGAPPPGPSPHPLDAGRLIDRAAREGLHGLLAAEIARLPGEWRAGLPLTRLAQARDQVFARNVAMLTELAGLGREFATGGVRVIALKGAALLHTVYRDRRHARPLSDLDLLVRPCDLGAADGILRARGYTPHAVTSTLYGGGTTLVDLHTELTGTARVRRKALVFSFSEEALWDSAVPLTPAAPGVLTLAPPWQFLHLVVHALKHGFTRLIWLVDLALVARQSDPDVLVEAARATGTLRALACATEVLRGVLAVEPHPRIREQLPALGPIERAFVRGVVARRAREISGELVVVGWVPGTRAKVAYLLELAFPRPAVLRNDFPALPGWLLYPRRLARLVAWGASRPAD